MDDRHLGYTKKFKHLTEMVCPRRKKLSGPLPIVFFVWKSSYEENRRSRGRVLRSSQESLEKLQQSFAFQSVVAIVSLVL
jgi:hypothetical protein